MERTAKLTFLFATVYFVQGIGSPSSGIAAQPVRGAAMLPETGERSGDDAV